MKKIGFIGAGNMGGALAAAAAKAECEIFVSDADSSRAQSLAEAVGGKPLSGTDIINECDLVFLAVKPNVLSVVAKEIGEALKKRGDICLVSMAAGVSIEKLGAMFPCKRIIRIMPNTPVSVGGGTILYSLSCGAEGEDEELLCNVLSFAGSLIPLDEKLIDAATAVSGCGPAFVCMFIEALADGGVKCGLQRDTALKLASQTVMGTAKLCLESGVHPEQLKDAVCSPGGSTIAGVAALEKGGLRAAAIDGVEAAYKRTKELS